jgi:molybdate transport system regulatory protein
LLDAIRCLGSLQAAAASVGISYRKAWGDLRAAEKALGIVFLERHRGGSSGGETRLTETGIMWLREFQRMHAEVEKSVEKAFEKWNERVGGGGRAAKRRRGE